MEKLAKIYGSANYQDLKKWDLVEKMKPLFKRGYFYDMFTRKITYEGSIAIDSPWVFIKKAPLKCDLWGRIIFEATKVIPSGCLTCYKIVVGPRTLDELFQLHDIMIDLDYPSKLGLEIRETVSRLYGAYFYCRSKEEGQEKYKIVREAVSTISPDVPVLLKRYCTEFEHEHGRSDEYVQSEDDKRWERLIDDAVALPESNAQGQPETIRNHIYKRWIEYAYRNNDPTAIKFNNNNPLYEDYITYHEV